MRKTRIAILGAGYAGTALSRRLLENMERENLEIMLIDRNDHQHNFQQLSLVATGFLPIDDVKLPFPILIDSRTKFIHSEVKAVQAEKKKLILDSMVLDYDFLVIAIGSRTNYFGIKGAAENAMKMKNADDAAIIHGKLEALLNKSGGNIVIIGGGPTGASLAGAIADYTSKRGASDKLHVILTESQPTILKGYNPLLASKVSEILSKKGVLVRTNSLVSKVTPNSVILQDGQEISSSISLWTAGVRGAELPSGLNLEITAEGRVIVNENCQCIGYPDIFSIGDISALKDDDGNLYPMLGQVAFRQAAYLAKQLISCISNSKFLPIRFAHKTVFLFVPLGIKDYAAHIGNELVISGNVQDFKTQLLIIREAHPEVDLILYDMQQEELRVLINKANSLKYELTMELRDIVGSS